MRGRGARNAQLLARFAFITWVPPVFVAGCATAPTIARSAPGGADAERATLDLRAQNAGYVRRIEELENRIFILEDQLDSRKLASEQRAPASLPQRSGGASGRVDAAEAAVGSSPVSDERASAIQTSIVAEHAVDYTGDAAQGAPSPSAAPPRGLADAGGPRPHLRLPASDKDMVPPVATAAPEPLPDLNASVVSRPVVLPLKAYRQALEMLRAGRPDAAVVAFRRFVAANPQHDYADNAQYWIGECHYDQGQFRAAEQAFRRVVEGYPRGNKVPDAMLKLGFTLQSLGDDAGGRAVLRSLTRAFPKHEAARLAGGRLAHPEQAPRARTVTAPPLGTILPALPASPPLPPDAVVKRR